MSPFRTKFVRPAWCPCAVLSRRLSRIHKSHDYRRQRHVALPSRHNAMLWLQSNPAADHGQPTSCPAAGVSTRPHNFVSTPISLARSQPVPEAAGSARVECCSPSLRTVARTRLPVLFMLPQTNRPVSTLSIWARPCQCSSCLSYQDVDRRWLTRHCAILLEPNPWADRRNVEIDPAKEFPYSYVILL